MRQRIAKLLTLAAGLAAGMVPLAHVMADDTKPRKTAGEPAVESLVKQVETLAKKDAWKGIPWRWCLLEASAESRRTSKPIFVYAIAGDPVGRC